MKRFVNGVEAELEDASGYEVERLADRLAVRGPEGTFTAAAVRVGDAALIWYRGRQYRIERGAGARKSGRAQESGEIFAPMPGQIVEVLVEAGQAVEDGQKLLVLEAMKTQQAFLAPFDGRVATVEVAKGAQVEEGALLARIEPSSKES
jgi:3-methylcrotonyl-CoA carboxylase alpha subunit